jgi:hypothetical protein
MTMTTTTKTSGNFGGGTRALMCECPVEIAPAHLADCPQMRKAPDSRNLAQEAAAGSEYFIHLMAGMDEYDKMAFIANILNTAYYLLLDFARQVEKKESRHRRKIMDSAITVGHLRDATLKSQQENYDGELLDWGFGGLATAAQLEAWRQGRAKSDEAPATDAPVQAAGPTDGDNGEPVR